MAYGVKTKVGHICKKPYTIYVPYWLDTKILTDGTHYDHVFSNIDNILSFFSQEDLRELYVLNTYKGFPIEGDFYTFLMNSIPDSNREYFYLKRFPDVTEKSGSLYKLMWENMKDLLYTNKPNKQEEPCFRLEYIDTLEIVFIIVKKGFVEMIQSSIRPSKEEFIFNYLNIIYSNYGLSAVSKIPVFKSYLRF